MKTEQELHDFENYLKSDDTRPSHTFVLAEARSYPPFTAHGLNKLPYALMPAVAFCMEKWADQEKAALKEKIRNHVVSKLAEYERDDDGDPWYNGAKTEMEELRKWLNAETLK